MIEKSRSPSTSRAADDELSRLRENVFAEAVKACRTAIEMTVALKMLGDFNTQIGERFANISTGKSAEEFEKHLISVQQLIETAQKSAPYDFRLHLWLGIVHLCRGEADAALACFETSGAWFSGNTQAFFYACRLHLAAGRKEAAQACASAALLGARRFRPAISHLARDLPLAAQSFDLGRMAAAALEFNPAWLYGGALTEAVAEAAEKRRRSVDAPVTQSAFVASELDATVGATRRSAAGADWVKEREDHVLWQNHCGYSLFRWGAHYYGLPASAAPLSLETIRKFEEGVRQLPDGAPLYREKTFSELVAVIRKDAYFAGRNTRSDRRAAPTPAARVDPAR